MARPRSPSGTTGRSRSPATAASGWPAAGSGTSTALPGKSKRWGSSRTAAQRELQDEMRKRRGERTELLRPHSRFRDAAALWIAKITERREDSTADTYRHWLDNLVLPELGGLQLKECDVAHIDAFFSRLEQARRTVSHTDGTTTEKVRYAANTRRTIRAIVAGVLQQAVLHQALGSNPVRELERIESPKGHRKAPPRGLTPEERRRLLAFRRHREIRHRGGPARPDPLRDRLRAAHRRAVRSALDRPQPRRHTGRDRRRHTSGAGGGRAPERLPRQG